MAAIFLDHNMALSVANLLRERGHTVTTAREIGLEGASDDEHLLRTADEHWILVTHNAADFTLLDRAWLRWSSAWGAEHRHSGILIVPQPPGLTVEGAAQALDDFIAHGLPLVNELFQLRTSGRWLRLDQAAGWVML